MRKLLVGALMGVVFGAVALAGGTGVASASAGDDCEALDGVYAEGDPDTCTVTTVEIEDFEVLTRPAGESGRGWTAEGEETTTTVEVYEWYEGTVEVLVAGDPTLPGCSPSGSQPKKCSDHYEDVEVAEWESDGDPVVSVDQDVDSCRNPGGKTLPGIGKEKAIHRHCAI